MISGHMAKLQKLSDKLVDLLCEIDREGFFFNQNEDGNGVALDTICLQYKSPDREHIIYSNVQTLGQSSRVTRYVSSDTEEAIEAYNTSVLAARERSVLRHREGDQPLPTEGQESVIDETLRFIESRRQLGIGRYGTELQTHNGRDALQDAMDECADLLNYLMQMKMECDNG